MTLFIGLASSTGAGARAGTRIAISAATVASASVFGVNVHIAIALAIVGSSKLSGAIWTNAGVTVSTQYALTQRSRTLSRLLKHLQHIVVVVCRSETITKTITLNLIVLLFERAAAFGDLLAEVLCILKSIVFRLRHLGRNESA